MFSNFLYTKEKAEKDLKALALKKKAPKEQDVAKILSQLHPGCVLSKEVKGKNCVYFVKDFDSDIPIFSFTVGSLTGIVNQLLEIQFEHEHYDAVKQAKLKTFERMSSYNFKVLNTKKTQQQLQQT